MAVQKPLRLSEQHLLPQQQPDETDDYELYPSHELGPGVIEIGFDALATHIIKSERIVIDGYVGVIWSDFAERLAAALERQGGEASFVDFSKAMLSEEAIEKKLEPFLGGSDPVFGTRTSLELADLFDEARFPKPGQARTIVYGSGAALCGWSGALTVYIDLPKNELQFRARAGTVANLGLHSPLPSTEAYKRFYFVDWILLNSHKHHLLPQIDLLIDGQHVASPTFMTGDALRTALHELTSVALRVRPWMEPGVWGGQWLKANIKGLAENVPNYAWSFELIVPENGLIFESSGHLLELSFDFLMYQESQAVLGEHSKKFGTDFPIRFDYLDTIDGGNLSVQCHPHPEYIKAQFGESFTQDETYYIVHCKDDAKVYLGFKESVDKAAFFDAVTSSQKTGAEVEVENFLNIEVAEAHTLYLIPNGTIHSSGKNNLVLEISATPYIFTFKIYDWLRLGLDGKPRPLNIERAMENLDFERRGQTAKDLVVKPIVLSETTQGRVLHLPTHTEHFYDVHRFELSGSMQVKTEGSPHVLCLVEGECIVVRVKDKPAKTYHFGETFIIPASATNYTLESKSSKPVKVIQAFLKPVTQQ